ncbi:uncharacterized protein PG986_011195 [Apiospora aurea]|uniref:Transaldolase n=1 Tax=Apiospora aurea TaxID=335848 RepID=A0ABR1Q4B7_9PEZI
MGIESNTAPPLPAPTESDSVLSSPTELATEFSKHADDEKSSFSLPDDGTPVTIKTRGYHQHNKSQTSLLIEYFEHSKTPEPSERGSRSRKRRPSVRVRLTPSKNREKNGHIQITETKSSRKSSMGKKSRDEGPLVQNPSRSELEVMTDPEDSRSMNSYASATEESNVSRHPIEVEINPSVRSSRRDRKVSSPLIPASDSKVSSQSQYVPPNMSDISAIPTDSFLDGSGGTGGTTLSNRKEERERSRSPSRTEPLAMGALGAATAAAVADKMNRKNRSASDDRKIIERAVEKASRPDKRHSRSSSGYRRSTGAETDPDSKPSSRRRSKGHKESVVSAADSSVLSSQLSPSQRSYDSHNSSKVSINNPKLLETVEDAIRRLILPELDAIKRERSTREPPNRRPKDKESLSSLTSVSREELSAANKRRSAETTHSTKSRGREARNDLSPHSSVEHISVLDSINDQDDTPRRGYDQFGTAALLGAEAAAGAAAAEHDRSRDDKRQRRRRRAKTPERGRASEDYRETEHEVIPPMPLSSEINPSEMTRTSILSANTDRPHSASEEMTPIQEVARGTASMESMHDTPTPTRTPQQQQNSLQGLGAAHANVSHGDLRALPRKGPGEYEDQELTESDLSQNYGHDEYDDEFEDSQLSEPGMFDPSVSGYYQQDVPPPLRYVPYQQERRGLSPIQSVSGYTDGGSDLHHRRDSRVTNSEVSSPDKSDRNLFNRDFDDAESDLRSSGYYRDTQYTDDSELDKITSGQAVRGVGANPQIVHQPIGTESAVASLVDGSVLDPSVLSGGQEYRDSQVSYDGRDLARVSAASTPAKSSFESRREMFEKASQSPAPSKHSRSKSSRDFDEYDLDEYGRKVPRPSYRHSPSPSEAAITSAALGRAAAAAKAKNEENSSPAAFEGEGVQRNRSFKERAKDGYRPNATPRHSVDRLSEDYDRPKMEASGLPNANDPLPEIGYFMEHQSPSLVQEPLNNAQYGKEQQWGGDSTPTQEKTFDYGNERSMTPKANGANGQQANGNGLGITEAAAAAAMAAAAGMASNHSREQSQDQDDEWQRTSGDRKRDTLVTNPYEGTSPIANLPGFEDNMLGDSGYDHDGYRGGFNTGSPGMPQGDEGYETAPNETRDMQAIKGKGVEFQDQPGMGGNNDDPFYTTNPKHQRHLSGMSQGMGSPFYDAATGTGIDRIESKDVIALMEHLMVRDAQRSARDREMIETVCQVIKEMHTSFRDVKRALADTEDQIINEVKDNTEKTVQRHLGGPRPLPGSASRSLQGGSQAGTIDDMPAKKRGLFRRALKGLSSKGNNDLGRIEDMLMHLLTEVDVLKQQTGGPGTLAAMSTRNQSLENMQPEMQYEQDRGYEPEGNAGTSTASHASQSGQFSIQSRGQPGRMGYERKFSDHRISTVHEGPEEEYNQPQVTTANNYSNPDLLMSPAVGPARAGSVPLGTPPQAPENHTSFSNENTPTDNSKKHKSKGSSSFLPKISRWSETTTSSIGKVFNRNSGNSRSNKNDIEEFLRQPPSRSGSELNYEVYEPADPYNGDKLHSGFSEQNLAADPGTPRYQLEDPPMSNTYSTPEDPKYKAHRNSVNLQHPQPRPGQTERFRTALESSAINYDTPMSPRSADWAGSATSLNRFPGQQSNRYSDQSAADEYRNAYSSSPAPQGPPRPPKEPLDTSTPPRNDRVNKLQKKQPSPLPYHSVESGYGTMTGTQHARTESYHSTSPRMENRNLSGALSSGAPARRPSGPRAMTPTRGLGSDDGDRRSLRSPLGDSGARDDRRRKRDTFGTVTGRDTAMSQESETF